MTAAGQTAILLRSRRAYALLTGGACLGAWLAVYVKVGSGLDYATSDYLARAESLPTLLVTGTPDDYRNWSILPLAVDRLLGVSTPRSLAIAHCLMLVVGTVTVFAWTARHRPGATSRALAAFIATPVPALVFFFMGNYDQILAVVLIAFALAQNERSNLVTGILLGLTHAAIGLVATAGVALLAWAGIGPRVRTRLPAIAGLLAARAGLGIWFAAAGQSTSRLTFIDDYGPSTLLHDFAATWPVAVWSLAGAAWIIVIALLVENPTRRLIAALAAIGVVTLGAVAQTVDTSRVAMLCTLAPLLVVAAHSSSPRMSRAIYVAGLVGVIVPLTVAWAGDVHALGMPLLFGW